MSESTSMSGGSIETILSSMGVDNYDPLVVTALKEYAHTFAGEILCDATDYARHRGKGEIEIADAKLAMNLTKNLNVAVTPQERIINDTRDMINRIPLHKLIPQETFGSRYPKERMYTTIISSPAALPGQPAPAPVTERGELIPDPATGLLQRRYTLVPGNVAFPSARGHRSGSFNKPLQQVPTSNISFRGVTMTAPEKEKELVDTSEI